MPAAVAAASVGVATARSAAGLPKQLGAPSDEIDSYTSKSAAWRDGKFHNVEPAEHVDPTEQMSTLRDMLSGRAARKPATPIPVEVPRFPQQTEDLAVTWFGHASALIEIDGLRVLVDPVWGKRASPSPTIGPARLHPIPLVLDALPELDVIVLSHDHYDHLDMTTVVQLAEFQRAPFVVPLGVGAHLRAWGIAADRITELDWGQTHTIGEVEFGCCRARHFSGRGLRRDVTLWASWTLIGPRHRVYFGGDSGYSTTFAEIGTRHGPFDLALLPIGAYDRRWPDIHLDPEEAVQAFADVQAGQSGYGVMLPIHWATFVLAPHTWDDPIVRTVAAAEQAGATLWTPPPGRRVKAESKADEAAPRWWSSDRP